MRQLIAQHEQTGRRRLVFSKPLDYFELSQALHCEALRSRLREGETLKPGSSTRRLRAACAPKLEQVKEAFIAKLLAMKDEPEMSQAEPPPVVAHEKPPANGKMSYPAKMIRNLLKGWFFQ